MTKQGAAEGNSLADTNGTAREDAKSHEALGKDIIRAKILNLRRGAVLELGEVFHEKSFDWRMALSSADGKRSESWR